MSTTVRRLLTLCALAPLGCVVAMSRPASADNFGHSYYDRATNELVVTMLYGGTNPNHKFTLKWGYDHQEHHVQRLAEYPGPVLASARHRT
jgi:hypothetical protein